MASEWSAAGWLSSVGIEQLLAGALLGEGFDGGDELEAIRTLGRHDHIEDELFARLAAGLGPLVALLAPRLRALATDEAATSGEMQDKFSQDTRGMLEYGNLNVFFGGLEALVGSPSPNIRKMMADEHTDRGDSAREFTTSNYDLRTTSATEWAFVATPNEPPEGGWPIEEKIRAALAGKEGADLEGIRKAGAQHRQPRPIAELTADMDAKVNGQLHDLGEPEMIVEEAMGLRLYTGPLFVKYNAVLRGLNSKVAFLQKALVGYCCDAATAEQFANGTIRYADAKIKLNLFTTTLHVINSGIVKTSKLTYAGKVYRGVSGLALPPEFWTPNKHGVRGGIEGAFMSTTTDKAVAMQYAASGGRGIVFEIQQGMIDRGADIGWLSQYPHEAEILFAPLTGLEVASTRVHGSMLIVGVSLSVNLSSLTIEQVIGKRKKLLKDMLPGLRGELRTQLAAEGLLNGEGIEFLLSRLEPRCEGGPLGHEADWYNVDEQLKQALDEMLVTRRGLGPGGRGRAEELLAVAPAEDGTRYGVPAAAFTEGVAKSLRELEDSDGGVCKAAVETLGELAAADLAVHARAIVVKLEHSDGRVRIAAVQTLGKLAAADPGVHAPAIVAKLEDSNGSVRKAAVETLGELAAADLAVHARAIVAKLEDSNGSVRIAAVETLGKLATADLAVHARAIVVKLEDSDWGVQTAAVETLGKLAAADLAVHAPAFVVRLEHSEADVRMVAMQALGKLAAADLAVHAPTIVAKLEDSDCKGRIAAVRTLGKLATADPAVHAPAIVAKLEDSDWYVRRMAVETLGKLAAADLAVHAPAIVVKLEDSEWRVRKEAVETLGKLAAADLAVHAPAIERRLEDDVSEDGDVCNAANEVLAALYSSQKQLGVTPRGGIYAAGVREVRLFKEAQNTRLGIIFHQSTPEGSDVSSDYTPRAAGGREIILPVIKVLDKSGIAGACPDLKEGDQVLSVNGQAAISNVQAVQMLRDACGPVVLAVRDTTLAASSGPAAPPKLTGLEVLNPQ